MRLCLAAGCLLCAAGCTQKDPQTQRLENASHCDEVLLKHITPIRAPLTLDQAIRYALKHNLDTMLAAREAEIRKEEASASRLSMLPQLTAEGETSERDKYSATTSADFVTGRQTEDFSYSSEKRKRRASLALVWNLLDFGISYFTSRQAAAQAAIQKQRVRRMRQTLALDTCRAYCRAIVAREAAAQAQELLAKVEKRLATVRSQLKEKAIPHLQGLREAKKIIALRARLYDFEREHATAQAELLNRLGLPPDAPVVLAAVDFSVPLDTIEYDLEALEGEAIRQRPELYEKDYEHRISVTNVRLAVARLLPSPAGFLRYDYDGDRYLRYANWHSVGLRATWDLLAIPQRMAQVGIARKRAELAFDRQLPVAIGVLTQVRLAHINYLSASREYKLAQEMREVQDQLRQATRQHFKQGKLDEASLLDVEADSMLARVSFLRAYCGVVTAQERIHNAVGRTPGSLATATLVPAKAANEPTEGE